MKYSGYSNSINFVVSITSAESTVITGDCLTNSNPNYAGERIGNYKNGYAVNCSYNNPCGYSVQHWDQIN